MKDAEARFSAVRKHAEAKNGSFPSEAMRKRAEAMRKHAETKKKQKRRAWAHAMCVPLRVAKTVPKEANDVD